MLVIYCSDPLSPRGVDEAYTDEASAAGGIGWSHELIQYEAIVNSNNPVRAVQRVARHDNEVPAIYRGWMLSPEHYSGLFTALLDKGVRLINEPAAYRHCHWLPESYSIIEPYTARTAWLYAEEGLTIDQAMSVLKQFGRRPVIVKDFVKSQKHYWHEACFIPDASDRASVERVVTRFLELQAEDLAGGLVFREFAELTPLATHSKSGMPLAVEYRVFVLDGHPRFLCNYWEEGAYAGNIPNPSQFAEVISGVRSRFFTMDIAMRADGNWMIIELGDGQVSGLQTGDPTDFYRALSASLS